MKARALGTFITVCLFIVASLVSTLGVFVPSAAASDDFSPAYATPTLLSPENRDTVDSSELMLVWGYDGEVASYIVQIAADTDFVTPLISETIDGATNYQVPADAGLAAGSTYHWRVAPIVEGDEVPSWSLASAFTIEDSETPPEVQVPPAAPDLLSPLPDASVEYEDIKNNLESAWLHFAPEDGVQTSQIKLSGEFFDDGEVASLDIDMMATGASFSMTELAQEDSEFPQLITGNTYIWAVRSSFAEDANKDSEEGWGGWSDDWTFTVVAKEPENDEPIDEGDTDEEDIAPKTTTTTITTTRVEHVVTVVTTSYTYPNPQLVYEGSGATLGDSAPVDRSISSTSTENSTENEEGEEPAEESGAFLLLGWWWLVVAATVAGGYYLFFRVPTK